ncbi:MAG TPA: sialate O-acetylesterase [Planctomycetota bacterium]|nr:sialate O-acetylesterase [Planctomycetota bacterium]HRR82189.1 sialate O-acetylesterase [Planctomycetota bacterium]HRT93895.1 sialate O-acetylesterase [Planctomycetota bacterium]
MRRWCGWVAVLAAAASALADVKLPAVISSNMVLQRGVKARLWGTAEPGEEVTVTLGAQKQSAKANDKGEWAIMLDALEAGGPHEITVAGKNTIKLENVLVGDVWVCSGQSNMEMVVGSCNNAQEEAEAANFPNIRHFGLQKAVSATPLAEAKGVWAVCSPQTVKGFTAVGYFFGRHLHKELNVPIGLLHTSWGGTPAQAWTSREALDAVPELKHYVAALDAAANPTPEAKQKYEEALKKWEADAAKAKEAKKQPPRKPAMPGIGAHTPAALYNAMIAPVLPYTVRGAIWYQGESNAGAAREYRTLFPTMIKNWRKDWSLAQGAEVPLPFFFVQLANFMAVDKEPTDGGWAWLREAQDMTLALPKTGQACIIDVGEAKDIHPRNKQDVGKRLALAALAIEYGKELVYSGPRFDKMTIEGNKARIAFKHVGGGLVAKPLEDMKPNGPTLDKRFGVDIADLRPKSEVQGFAIAGEDLKFVWAEARIDGETVVVSSPKVEKPVAVRYAWGNNPICNLYNKADLPACPFRTDEDKPAK